MPHHQYSIEGVERLHKLIDEWINGLPQDPRPPRGSWAPGQYLNRCCQCDQYFIGDKRAGSCADCAYATPDPNASPDVKIAQ